VPGILTLIEVILENFHGEPVPEEQPTKKSGKPGCMGLFIDTLETVLLALVLFLGINAISARVRVENISMKPTLQPGEFVLINKLAYKIGKPSHGDVIVFHYPRDPKQDYIKRVIGIPGDTVTVSGGVVSVNNTPLTEPYISAPPAYPGSWKVPSDSLFVLGDNRNQSSDSHIWGFVPLSEVVGKGLVIYWPLDSVQILDHPDIVKAAPR
jgi:signal peptidase I